MAPGGIHLHMARIRTIDSLCIEIMQFQYLLIGIRRGVIRRLFRYRRKQVAFRKICIIDVRFHILNYFLFSIYFTALAINSLKIGCAPFGRDLNSGCAWVAM